MPLERQQKIVDPARLSSKAKPIEGLENRVLTRRSMLPTLLTNESSKRRFAKRPSGSFLRASVMKYFIALQKHK